MYATKDGFLNLAAPWGRLWGALCGLIDRPELEDDPRFRTPADRATNREALNAAIGEVLASRTTTEWVETMNALGIPAGPVKPDVEPPPP